jgi:hypothetical protein
LTALSQRGTPTITVYILLAILFAYFHFFVAGKMSPTRQSRYGDGALAFPEVARNLPLAGRPAE